MWKKLQQNKYLCNFFSVKILVKFILVKKQSTVDSRNNGLTKKIERRKKSGKILDNPLKALHRWKAESEIYTMERGFQGVVQDFTRFFGTFNFFAGCTTIRAFTVVKSFRVKFGVFNRKLMC